MQFVVAECGRLWRQRVGLLSILVRIFSR